MAQNRRSLIDAQFALNEGGSGRLDKEGRPLELFMHVAEKTAQNYTLVARNPGGHSSMPRPDNAIYELASALSKVQGCFFLVHMNPTTTAFFHETNKLSAEPQSMAQAMKATLTTAWPTWCSRAIRCSIPRCGRPRRDAARGRPGRERPASARPGQCELPDSAGRKH